MLCRHRESPSEQVVSAFKHRLRQWPDAGASKTILLWIHQGFWLPLTTRPLLRALQNHRMDDLHRQFVSDEILRLMRSGAIQALLPHERAMISPLGVANLLFNVEESEQPVEQDLEIEDDIPLLY